MFHSEFGQDRWLNENVFHDRRSGVFFEAGALDGVMDSNSLFFEESLGWTGLLVEPNPEAAALCRSNRKVPVVQKALSDVAGETSFETCEGWLFGWSGIESKIEPQHAARIKTHVQIVRSIKVACEPLQSILKQNGLTRLDYCVLDIEGAEFDVLAAFDWVVPVEIFEIEDNWGNKPIDQLMEKNGYRKLVRLGVSNIYQKIQ